MGIQKIIRRRVRKRGDGIDLVGDVNAAIAANVGEKGAHTRVSSRQRIVQKSRSRAETRDGEDANQAK